MLLKMGMCAFPCTGGDRRMHLEQVKKMISSCQEVETEVKERSPTLTRKAEPKRGQPRYK